MTFINTAAAFTIVESGDTVVIDGIIDDDVIVTGAKVIIEGIVRGDVIDAGGTVQVKGTIEEDLIVAAGNVIISGNVGDDIRIAAGTLTIEGGVQDDVIAFAGETVLSDSGNISGDLLVTTGKLTMAGDVGEDLTGSAKEIDIEGSVGGNADLNAEIITISPKASIAGNLEYRSSSKVDITEGTVGKELHYYQTDYHEKGGIASSMIRGLISYLALVLIGLIGLAIWPNYLEDIAAKTSESPGKAFLTGLLVIIVSIMITLLLFVTLIGIPLGLILMITLLIMLYVARIISSIWIGRYLLLKMGKTSKTMNEMAFGLLVLLLVSAIPIIGGLVYIVATLIPVGNIYMKARH
jgi:cytoskeletal protein CcmA (bactofilin family)